jgi:regulator of RNase E activity RraA
VSTATLCTALFKRGLRNQFIQDVRPLNPGLPNMVGEAFTLRYIPAREDLNPITVFQDRGHPQRKAVEECPPGAVLVIDSRKDARAASAGGILGHAADGQRGAGVRHRRRLSRQPEIAKLPFPAYHQRPSAPTNLTLHQALDINVPIGCGDAPVWPGDVVVGDARGRGRDPRPPGRRDGRRGGGDDGVRGLRAGARDGGPVDPGLYPPTDDANRAAFDAWRSARGR